MKDKENRTHTARAGESLSLIAGYPNAGWRDRLDQLIAANSELPSIRDRSPDDPRYAWLDIGDVINIPWDTPGEGDGSGKVPREVRDGDENLWYVEDWNKAETDEQARKNRGIGKGEKLSLAYEGYEVSDPKRLPNSLDSYPSSGKCARPRPRHRRDDSVDQVDEVAALGSWVVNLGNPRSFQVAASDHGGQPLRVRRGGAVAL